MSKGLRKNEERAGNVDSLLAHEGKEEYPANRVEWVWKEDGGGERDVDENDGEAEEPCENWRRRHIKLAMTNATS